MKLKDLTQNISPFTLFVFAGWITLFFSFDLWELFKESYFMTLTMALGSFIAGATSEGGGAVAFPVMTLIFGISPEVARDFSLLIQSFGMTAASLVIYRRKIPVVNKAIIFSGLGGIIGNLIAFKFLSSLFSPPALKLFFCSFWLSFVFVLVKLKWKSNTDRKGQLPEGKGTNLLLFLVGVVGGAVTGLTGSGLDILTFSLLTLYFNICEKVATPTSVVLMAINSICASLLKTHTGGGLTFEAFNYFLVCLPVVIFGAPLGSVFISTKSRKFITAFLMTTISAQFIAALFIVPLNKELLVLTAITLACGTGFFLLLSRGVGSINELVEGRSQAS